MTTSRARSGRPWARRAARARRPAVRASPWSAIPARGGQRLAIEAVQLGRQGVEHVALGRLVAGPGDEVADVARGHAERVGHDRRQVGRRSCRGGSRPGRRRGTGPCGRRACRCVRTQEQLRQRPRVERERDLVRDGLRAGVRAAAGAGRGHQRRRVARVRLHLLRQGEPGRRVGVPGEAEGGEAGAGLRGRRGLQLGGRQDVRERVEVVADADPSLGDRLERGRAAAAERVEHDVARARVARDEGVRQRRREAREVRAHRVEAVAPEAGLVLPLGLDRERGERARQLEGELAGGDGP